MENLNNSIKLDSFPFTESRCVSDLIFNDFPILSLYTLNDEFFLKYLVDEENLIDTFVFLKINGDTLYKLTKGKTSLLDVISKSKEFLYVFDENQFGDKIETVMISPKNLLTDYLPEANSILNFQFDFAKIPELERIFSKIEAKNHTAILRKNAVYLKFSSKIAKYGQTVPFGDIVKSLPKIQSSFKNFTKALFENYYNEKITDVKKLNKLLNQVEDLVEFKVVDLQFNSFQIGLNYDEVMVNDPKINRDIIEWSKSVPKKFENEVLNYDSNNLELNELIDEQFSNKQKTQIYKPIIEIARNKNLIFSIKKNKDDSFKTISVSNFNKVERVIESTKIKVEENIDEEYEIVQLTAIVPKGKEITSIKTENNLFSHVNEITHKITQQHFDNKGYNYKLKEDLLITIKPVKGNIEFSTSFNNEIINYFSIDKNTQTGIDKLTEKVYEYIKSMDL